MKRPRARWRWWLKWMGVAVCAGVVAGIVLSRWWLGMANVFTSSGRVTLSVLAGHCECALKPGGTGDFRVMWTAERLGEPQWAFEFPWVRIRTSTSALTAFPAWYLLLPPGIASIILFRTDRDRRTGCKKCGYSREGLAADAVCPECGNAASSQPAPSARDPHS